MERIVYMTSAFDRRHAEGGKNYGIHGVDMRMILKGSEGAVQFVLYTNWHLPHVQEELDNRPDAKYPHLFCHPLPADLGYHSPVPMYDGHTPVEGACEWLDGKPCYYDGSGLNAERIYQTLLKEGSDGVWRELELYYKQTFNKGE